MEILQSRWTTVLTDHDEEFLQGVDTHISKIVELLADSTSLDKFFILLGLRERDLRVYITGHGVVNEINVGDRYNMALFKLDELRESFYEYGRNAPISVRIVADKYDDKINSLFSYEADDYAVSFEKDCETFTHDILKYDDPFKGLYGKPDVKFEEV